MLISVIIFNDLNPCGVYLVFIELCVQRARIYTSKLGCRIMVKTPEDRLSTQKYIKIIMQRENK